jgi:hypothetical protein
MNRLTAIEIIAETVAYYSADVKRRSFVVENDPRNDGNNTCVYQGPNGEKCAYSRCWKEGAYNPNYEENTADQLYQFGVTPDDLVSERYMGHSDEFWYDLQMIHDGHPFWDENGLTDMGRIAVDNINKKYINK